MQITPPFGRFFTSFLYKNKELHRNDTVLLIFTINSAPHVGSFLCSEGRAIRSVAPTESSRADMESAPTGIPHMCVYLYHLHINKPQTPRVRALFEKTLIKTFHEWVSVWWSYPSCSCASNSKGVISSPSSGISSGTASGSGMVNMAPKMVSYKSSANIPCISLQG